MSRPRILITGASGFIARTLIPRLMDEVDITLLLLEDFGNGAPLPTPLNKIRAKVDVVYADLRNFQLTARALRQARPDRIIHLAAVGVSEPFLNVNTALSHNVTGTINLLRACFESDNLDVQQVIVARTPGERTVMNVYAASKAAAWAFCEMYARTAGWPIHGAMIFQAYGPGQPSHLFIPAVLRAALAGEEFPMTSGDQEKDWIYIDDVVAGFSALLKSELPAGETVEFGCSQPESLAGVADRIFRLVGRGGGPILGALPNRPGEDPRQVADAKRTTALIGWDPQISLEQGLERLINDDTN